MGNREPGWELYRSFLAVLREGSLSGAARALGLTQPTIGRHIRELESSLGSALFSRAPDGLRATDAARTVEPHAQTMAAAAAALIRLTLDKGLEAQSVIRIAASEIVGAEILPAILAEFRSHHPGVVFELSLSDRTEDLLRRNADIAVRMARPVQAALVARRIGSATVGLHAHRRYVAEHGRPSKMEDLAQHVLIGFDHETASVRALRRAGMTLNREDFSLRTDSHLAQLAAIRAGYGIGMCQTAIARPDSDLVHLLPNHFGFNLEVWLAMHEDLRASRPMRTIFDYLAVALSDYAHPKRR
jgi:DNA-binding transcriptional LysR family regulator